MYKTKITFFLIVTLWLFGIVVTVGQDCNILSKANDIHPDRLCAPVNVSWKVTYRGVNDGGTGDVKILFDWDDGGPTALIPAIKASAQEWTVTHTHVYPIGGDKCNYHPTVYLVVAGSSCSSTIQEQIVTVWDTDDMNGGKMVINPDVFPICYGNDGTVTFNDVSNWNCTPPDENDVPNNRRRWIQWVYGTGGTNINTAKVNGVVETYPFSGIINMTTEPILAPVAPFNQTESIYIPAGYNVGDFFEVTLRNWNYCNPYDTVPNDGLPPADPINGDFPPVETTAIAIIVALPDGTITAVGPFCENELPINLAAADPGGSWSGLGITNSSSGTFDPSVAGPGLHTINYDITNTDGCSATGVTTIRVWDAPEANILGDPATYLCPGIDQTLDGNPSQGTTPYTHLWTGDTGPLNNTNIQTPNFNTVTTGTYDLVYRVTDSKTCFDEDTIAVHVYPVDIHFENTDLTLCANILDTLKPEPKGGSGVYSFHLWSGSRTDLLSNANIEKPTFLSPTSGLFKYEYYVKDSQGCEASDSIFVTVHQQPTANAGANDTICGVNNTMNAIPSIGTGTWSLISGAGGVAFADIHDPNTSITVDTYGSYSLEWLEDNSGCEDTDSVNFVFYKIPEPVAAADGDTCGLAFDISVAPDLGAGRWSQSSGPGTVTFFNDTQTSTAVVVSIPGDYVFRWTEANSFGCSGSDSMKVNFYPVPVASIAPFDTSGCNPVIVDFQNSSTNADTYSWNFNDGFISNQKDPSHTFRNPMPTPYTFSIVMVAYNAYGCVDTTTQELTVSPTPISSIATDRGPGCSPITVNFDNKSEGTSIYEWDMGDGSPLLTNEDVTHTFYNSETFVKSFEVKLAVENSYGCTDTSNTYITVYPQGNFTLTAQPDSGCSPVKIDLISEPGAFSYSWEFGDGQSIQGSNAISHIYENSGNTIATYNAKLYTSSVFGCLDTANIDINVKPSPESKFSYTPKDGCAPVDVQFTNESGNVTSSIWKFGNGDELSLPNDGSASYTYVNNGYAPDSYRVSLVVENVYSCTDSTSSTLNIYPKVTASLSDGDSGCSPHNVTFINGSVNANKFLWNYGDGNSSTKYSGFNTFINTTNNDVTYSVVLTAISNFGCSNTDTTQVTVYRTPQPAFDVTPIKQQMPNSTVTLTNNTPGNSWDYTWLWGDGNGSTGKDPNPYTYSFSGDYDIKLIVEGEHCSDSTNKSIIILTNLPTIDYGPDAEGCPPLTVQFYNNSTESHTFMWEFGDGAVSSEKEPKHTYYASGEYKVKLAVYGPGGTAEAEDVTIKVFDSPKAYFEAVPNRITIPGQSVSFLNRSTDAISSFWDLGDGNTSTEFSFMYEYKEAGVYDVSLEVTNDAGCKDSYVQLEACTAEQGGKISFPNAFTPNPAGSNGGHYTYGEKENFVFYPYVQEGIDEYTLQIYTRWGELIFESHDIKIGWDGYYRGKLSPQGVYIYKATCKFGTGLLKVTTGDVTLIR